MSTYCDAEAGLANLFFYSYEADMIQWLLKRNGKESSIIPRSVIYIMSFHWVVLNVLIAPVP